MKSLLEKRRRKNNLSGVLEGTNMKKRVARLKRAKRSRLHIREMGALRLSVHRTPKHIYAQILAPTSEVLVSASTLDKSIRANSSYTGNISSAEIVGKLIAERALKKGIKAVAFDRSGFLFHGRVKKLADAARESGLEF